MPKKRTVKKEDDSKLFAFLAAFLSIIGFVIALVAKKDNRYVMFYAKQSLVVFIVIAVLGAGGMVLYWIPIIGKIIWFAVNLISFIVWLISWVYALSGEEKEVPIIGKYARNIKL